MSINEDQTSAIAHNDGFTEQEPTIATDQSEGLGLDLANVDSSAIVHQNQSEMLPPVVLRMPNTYVKSCQIFYAYIFHFIEADNSILHTQLLTEHLESHLAWLVMQ